MGLFTTKEYMRTLLQNSRNHHILSITVQNFMSLRDKVTVSFDERGILSPVGYNDSGKTAFLTAQLVMYTFSKASKHVKMIHGNENAFYIENTFSDGVRISLTKYRTGESLWEMSVGEELIYSNRATKETSGTILTTNGGIPEYVAAYLNVATDDATNELVNFRSNKDKLFLVHTSNGDNGKMINNHLQLQMVSEALQVLNTKNNLLNSSVLMNTTKAKTLIQELTTMSVMTVSEEDMIKAATENYQKQLEQGFEVNDVLKSRENIRSNSSLYEEVPIVETVQAQELLTISSLSASIRKGLPPEVEVVSDSQLKELLEIERLNKAVKVSVPPEMNPLDTSQCYDYQNVVNLHSSVKKEVHPEVEIASLEQYNDLKGVLTARENLGILYDEVPVVDEELRRKREYMHVMSSLSAWQSSYQDVIALDEEAFKLSSTLQQLATSYNYKICNACGTIVL